MPETRYGKCPTCGFATIYKGQDVPDYMELLERIRPILTAYDRVIPSRDARLLTQEIDALLLSR